MVVCHIKHNIAFPRLSTPLPIPVFAYVYVYYKLNVVFKTFDNKIILFVLVLITTVLDELLMYNGETSHTVYFKTGRLNLKKLS